MVTLKGLFWLRIESVTIYSPLFYSKYTFLILYVSWTKITLHMKVNHVHYMW